MMIDIVASAPDAVRHACEHRCFRWVPTKVPLSMRPGGDTVARVHHLGQLHGGRVLDGEVQVVVLAVELRQCHPEGVNCPEGPIGEPGYLQPVIAGCRTALTGPCGCL